MSIRHKDQPVLARRRGHGIWEEGIITNDPNDCSGPNRFGEYTVHFPFSNDTQSISIKDLQRAPIYDSNFIRGFRILENRQFPE